MMRKMMLSLMFLIFMIILATCSMVKEQGQTIAYGGEPTAPVIVQLQ